MKNYGLTHILTSLWRGYTLNRTLLNIALSRETLKGKVVDIGGGHNPNYYDYFQKESSGMTIQPIDGSMNGLDFEKDKLPYEDNSVDTTLLCNVLEHIYNYKFLLSETYRIMKPSARLIGFVPFWVGYHADPRDYFRYTDECLIRILEESGFKNIKISKVGRGPFLGNFNNIVLSLPKFLRPILFITYNIIDYIYIRLRPSGVVRNPLGYVFTANK